MPSLIAYRKITDAVTTYSIKLPFTEKLEQAGYELCTLPDGRTVVTLFDGYTLPSGQPTQIELSLQTLPNPLPDDLRDAIMLASPKVKFIHEQVRAQINNRYSIDDQINLLRTAPSEEMNQFNAFAESCVAWGKEEKAKYGL